MSQNHDFLRPLDYSQLMKYPRITKAKFVERPNRFIARVIVDGTQVDVHVKNTGRCKELLVPGATVFLEDFEGRMGTRKYRWSLVGVEKSTENGILLVNMDSQAPNQVVEEALEEGRLKLDGLNDLKLIRRETVHEDSRFDFYIEDKDGQKAFIEVKGVTLEHEGHASFPDAPTERGIKHLKGLARCAEQGFSAYALFVIQMQGMKDFAPDALIHPDFAEALSFASQHGVKILAIGCKVCPDSLELNTEDLIPVRV